MIDRNIILTLASEKRILESLRIAAYNGDVECCKAIAFSKERINKLRNLLWEDARTETEIIEETL